MSGSGDEAGSGAEPGTGVEPAGDRAFPEPPRAFTDPRGRRIELRAYGGEREPLLAMHRGVDPSDRAFGCPPPSEERLRAWIGTLVDRGHNVLAWHAHRVVGHATLAPESVEVAELAVFVAGDYQGAGIGTRLVETLLGLGRSRGVRRVWLLVERSNPAARGLYRKVGFETEAVDRTELRMALRLD